MIPMLVKPAPFIRYPHSKSRLDGFYRVDEEIIDSILLKQKDSLYEMYNHMTNKNFSLNDRHKLRRDAFFLLELFLPLWKMFDYEYKYEELFQLFDEYTIA
jgi:hypothetical protein